jgi:S1-C subfamily serine protease
MTEYDLPPSAPSPQTPAGPSRQRRPRPKRSALLFAIAVLVVAVAAAVAAISVDHLLRGSTPARANTTSPPQALTPSTTSSAPLDAAGIAARVDPGLVDINVEFGRPQTRGSATGMVLTPTGEVLTNNHVINGATRVSVTDIGNGRTYSANVVGYDRTHDVAVLQLQGASGLQTVPLGASATVTVGARVTALGNAGGAGGAPKSSHGRVTALQQTITASEADGFNPQRLSNLIETDASVQPGDSGGPLVSDSGRVIGMDAATSVGYASQPSLTQGYAIPIDDALAIARQVEAGASSATIHVGPTGFLGVQVIPTGQPGSGFGGPGTSQVSGAALGGVLSGYPAQKAGLSQGDLITSVNGHAVTSPEALTALLSAHHPGDTVQIDWVDPSGQTHVTAIALAQGPPA